MSFVITIISSQHVSANPRVWKSANALSALGYTINICTTWYSDAMLIADKELLSENICYKSSFTMIYSWKNFVQILFAKACKKTANYLYFLFGISSVFQEVYLPISQLRKILNTRSDLFICHQESGLLLGVQLIKRGKRVAFDFEDWYAEDYLNCFRPVKLFRKYEAHALNYAEYVTCPSDSMSKALQQYYKLDCQVSVVYNSFPPGNIQDNHIQKIPNSLVWFSQTIGPNRGIEDFMHVLRQLDIPVEIHFIGFSSISYKQYLLECLNDTPHNVKIHSSMKHSDMINFVKQFEYGLALEDSFSLSRNLTVSNKILLYLQLNLHVFATSTKGHLELKSNFGDSISYIEAGKTSANAELIRSMLIRGVNKPAIEMGKYDWKLQEQMITGLVEDALNK